MKNPCYRRGAVMIVVLGGLLAGCRSEPVRSTPRSTTNSPGVVNLDAVLTEASTAHRPVIVLIVELGQGSPDNAVSDLLENPMVGSRGDQVIPILLDIGISRNRATATRFHVMDTPMLVCLTSGGVIVSRDEKPITKDLVLKRIDEAVQSAPQIDAEAGRLLLLWSLSTGESPAANELNGAMARLNLADFLLAHHNAREAVPHLAAVAHLEAAETSVRVRAWVALARAHLWIAEPEKGRHEAKDLITILGPKTPEALAGGNLVLGLQDAKGKRFAIARREFADAIAAAPDSDYARQAAEEVAKFPTGGK